MKGHSRELEEILKDPQKSQELFDAIVRAHSDPDRQATMPDGRVLMLSSRGRIGRDRSFFKAGQPCPVKALFRKIKNFVLR